MRRKRTRSSTVEKCLTDFDPPAATDATPSSVLIGFGELRGSISSGKPYTGQIDFPERTIWLEAKLEEDENGRFFFIRAKIDPGDYTQTELDGMYARAGIEGLLTATSSLGAGLGGARRLPPVGPIEDDPIPFGAA